ncbi:MAG: hypothetical protein ACK4V6_16835 [Microthrixaceae bacterium]
MPLRFRTALIVLALSALVVGAAACKEPTASEATTTVATTSVFVDVAGATPDQINEVADVVTDRLQALDLQRGEVGWDDASIEVIVNAEDEQVLRDTLGPGGDSPVPWTVRD